MRLCVVMPVPDHRVAAASRATDALWPAGLAHQGEALRVVEQGREVDWVHCGHDDRNPSCSPTTVDRLEPSSSPNPPSRASVTPEADESHRVEHGECGAADDAAVPAWPARLAVPFAGLVPELGGLIAGYRGESDSTSDGIAPDGPGCAGL